MNYTELIEFFNGDVNEAAYKLKLTTASIYNYRAHGITPKSLPYIENRIRELKMDQAAQQELENERYQRLTWALQECFSKGISKESYDTLLFETGFSKKDFDNMKEKQNEVE